MSNEQTAPASEAKRKDIAQAVMGALYQWRMNVPEQMALLDLERIGIKSNRLTDLAGGKQALPDDVEIMERARHILGISHALRDFFPLNQSGGSIWLRNTNKYFPDRAPISHMLDDGLAGMRKVWVNLDCTQGWD